MTKNDSAWKLLGGRAKLHELGIASGVSILFLPSLASAVYFLIPGDYKEIARDEVTSTCGLTGPGIAILFGLPYFNKDGACGQEKGVYMEKIMSDPDLKLDITHP